MLRDSRAFHAIPSFHFADAPTFHEVERSRHVFVELCTQAVELQADVIVEINKKTVKDMIDYRKVVSSISDTKGAISFRLIRDNRETFEFVKP